MSDVVSSSPMPQFQIERIANLKCPKPLNPSIANSKVNSLNKSIQLQVDRIKILEQMVDDLESRYKIRFTCDASPKILSTNGQYPNMILTGNITNINIGINMQGASKGLHGLQGEPGEQGKRGNKNISGNDGKNGNYGIRGDVK